MSDLLFEIGTEELPAGFQLNAVESLADLFAGKAEKLNIIHGEVRTFSTPRRLAIVVENLADRQPDVKEELLGPSRQAGFDAEGNPTRAAEGFARSKGASVEDLTVVDTPKGEYLQLVRNVEGVATETLLPQILKELILDIPFAKSMKWGTNQETFARPIQWLLALFGSEIVAFEHEGIYSGAITRGHRFLAPAEIVIISPDTYEETLESAFVTADSNKRKEQVITEIKRAVAEANFSSTAEVAIDEGLLDTVTNLVEIPYGICGNFDEKFLQIPEEVLVTSMREHQKYFPVVARDGSLLPGFVAVNNTKVLKTALTMEGHQRVLRARLEDAYFFYESDKKTKLADRVEKLAGVIFQAKLGSMQEKSERIIKLSRMLAESLAPQAINEVCRAALLCKADLTTDMVGEFPSLQGVMGSSYAQNDQESAEVVAGIREHYLPLRAGSELPSSTVGAIVGLADRIDTVAGCFGIGQIPSGTADPFGLRRLSLAILAIIQVRDYVLFLPEVFDKALALYGDKVDGGRQTTEKILQFVKGRFINDCVAKGMDPGAVEAVTSVSFSDVRDCLKRIDAFSAMRQDESFAVLAGSFKRIRNIVKDNAEITIDEQLLAEAAEKELYRVYKELAETGRKMLADENYQSFLQAMLTLKDPVDRFFDDVMVMAEDEQIKKNRLNLLTAVNNLILNVGDISRLHRGR